MFKEFFSGVETFFGTLWNFLTNQANLLLVLATFALAWTTCNQVKVATITIDQAKEQFRQGDRAIALATEAMTILQKKVELQKDLIALQTEVNSLQEKALTLQEKTVKINEQGVNTLITLSDSFEGMARRSLTEPLVATKVKYKGLDREISSNGVIQIDDLNGIYTLWVTVKNPGKYDLEAAVRLRFDLPRRPSVVCPRTEYTIVKAESEERFEIQVSACFGTNGTAQEGSARLRVEVIEDAKNQ